jgi:hypothetical protein
MPFSCLAIIREYIHKKNKKTICCSHILFDERSKQIKAEKKIPFFTRIIIVFALWWQH